MQYAKKHTFASDVSLSLHQIIYRKRHPRQKCVSLHIAYFTCTLHLGYTLKHHVKSLNLAKQENLFSLKIKIQLSEDRHIVSDIHFDNEVEQYSTIWPSRFECVNHKQTNKQTIPSRATQIALTIALGALFGQILGFQSGGMEGVILAQGDSRVHT